MHRRFLTFLASLLLVVGLAPLVHGGEAGAVPSIVVASTTSTQDSGLFDVLLPRFRERTGIDVKVIAQGTGQALDTARRGDANVVLVHDEEAEKKFVAEGHGLRRQPVMYNDFVVVGPVADPARVRASRDVLEVFRAIREARSSFISRGDRSGTHQAELRLWKEAGLSVSPADDGWYRSVGQGMGPVLNMASSSGAYTLVDRATWLTFGNKRDLSLLFEGDARLFNQYGVILVNPQRHPHLDAALGQRFIDYLISAEGQKLIGDFRVGGQQLFHPNADKE